MTKVRVTMFVFVRVNCISIGAIVGVGDDDSTESAACPSLMDCIPWPIKSAAATVPAIIVRKDIAYMVILNLWLRRMVLKYDFFSSGQSGMRFGKCSTSGLFRLSGSSGLGRVWEAMLLRCVI